MQTTLSARNASSFVKTPIPDPISIIPAPFFAKPNSAILGQIDGFIIKFCPKAFEKVNGVSVPYAIGPRRDGDVAACYADPKKAKEVLGWTATKNLEDMCRDTWIWQSNNPKGYDK